MNWKFFNWIAKCCCGCLSSTSSLQGVDERFGVMSIILGSNFPIWLIVLMLLRRSIGTGSIMMFSFSMILSRWFLWLFSCCNCNCLISRSKLLYCAFGFERDLLRPGMIFFLGDLLRGCRPFFSWNVAGSWCFVLCALSVLRAFLSSLTSLYWQFKEHDMKQENQ